MPRGEASCSTMRHGEASRSNMPSSHFFKPLLPGFIAGVDIPLRFFSKFLEERTDLRTLMLRSEATETNWWVDLDGRKLTKGWKAFVEAHQLEVGDILVFKYIGDLTFNVIAFGPSCCEIQYLKGGDDVEEEETMSEGQLVNHFVLLTVTNDTLKRSRIFLPKEFVTTNGLEAIAGSTICLASENGVRWDVKLAMECGDKRNRMRLTEGLAGFLKTNHIEANTTLQLELSWENATTPLLRVCPNRKRQETGQSISFLKP